MRIRRILLVGRAITDVGPNDDQRRPRRFVTGRVDGVGQGRQIVTPVANILDVPAITAKPLPHVIRIRQGGIPFDTDMVIIIDKDQLAQPQMPGQRGGFVRRALHKVAVAAEHIGIMIHHRMTRPVERRGQVRLGHRHAHCVHHSLPQWPSGHLNPRREAIFRMPRRFAPPLPKILDVL